MCEIRCPHASLSTSTLFCLIITTVTEFMLFVFIPWLLYELINKIISFNKLALTNLHGL